MGRTALPIGSRGGLTGEDEARLEEGEAGLAGEDEDEQRMRKKVEGKQIIQENDEWVPKFTVANSVKVASISFQ